MSDLPPPLPSKPPLGKAFWVALFLPIGLIMITLIFINSSGVVLPLIVLGLAILACPLYCGFRLAAHWAVRGAGQIVLGLFLAAGLGCVYLAVAFAGCMTQL